MAQIALQNSDPNIPEKKSECEGHLVSRHNCFLPCQSWIIMFAYFLKPIALQEQPHERMYGPTNQELWY